MIAKDEKKGTIRFSIRQPNAKKVQLVGDFNGWKPTAMRKTGDNFSVSLNIPAGSYHYKFIVDGRWLVDPDHNDWAANPYGTLNSVVNVGSGS